MFFFFSSRRRHTRSKRDWSSDVCSSDLLVLLNRNSINWGVAKLMEFLFNSTNLTDVGCTMRRSEERRVGKECRSRWSPDDEKKRRRMLLRLQHLIIIDLC